MKKHILSALSGKKLIILGLALIIIMAGCVEKKDQLVTITIDEAGSLALNFINENLMQPGTEVTVKEVVDENGLYKVVVDIPGGEDGQGQVIDSYLSKDGKKFFTAALDVAEVKQKAQEKKAQEGAAAANTPTEVVKQDKAKVELFVMSHCPYGTQIEKGILPVLKTLGDKVDFELKFCDYAMHDKKEIDEQLNQYCIQKNEPTKLLAYLECFLEADKGAECLTSTGINKTKLASCVSATDTEFNITSDYEAKANFKGRFPSFAIYKDDAVKYGVSGSPSLVINGAKASAGRDSASLLKAICAGYTNPPAECETELSAASPSPGFGFGTTGGGGSAASCE